MASSDLRSSSAPQTGCKDLSNLILVHLINCYVLDRTPASDTRSYMRGAYRDLQLLTIPVVID
jgi:hypothetical protein